MSAPPMRVGAVLALAIGSLVALLPLSPKVGSLAWSWAALDLWYGDVGPAVVASTIVWAGALAVATWLILSCVLQLVAALPVGRLLQPLADRIAPAALRGLAGASFAAGLLATTPLIAGAGDAPGTATMHPLADDESTPTTTVVPTTPSTPARPVVVADPVPDSYTVVRSESFWSIAVDRMTEVLQRPPVEREVRPYWMRLIEVNRERLVDPGNADLLYAGQVLVLPPES